MACAIAVVVVDRDAGTVDGQLLEVGATVAVELGVQVGEETALEERVFCEIDTADDVTRLELGRLVLGDAQIRGIECHTMTCSVSAK